MKTTHAILVTVESNLSGDAVARLVDTLIKVGIADAATTLEEGEGDETPAQDVLDMEIATPQLLGEHQASQLLIKTDDYLREIRAENLDGSEPALGTLLDQVSDFWQSQGNTGAVLLDDYRELIATGLLRDLMDVLHPGAIGLIHQHHGADRGQEASQAVTAAEVYLRAQQAVETLSGTFDYAGTTLHADFQVPVGATTAAKDAAFMAALAQQADIDYTTASNPAAA